MKTETYYYFEHVTAGKHVFDASGLAETPANYMWYSKNGIFYPETKYNLPLYLQEQLVQFTWELAGSPEWKYIVDKYIGEKHGWVAIMEQITLWAHQFCKQYPPYKFDDEGLGWYETSEKFLEDQLEILQKNG